MTRDHSGEKFYFDRNGAMLTGWHAVKEKADSDDATGISRFVYLGGKRTTELISHKGQK